MFPVREGYIPSLKLSQLLLHFVFRSMSRISSEPEASPLSLVDEVDGRVHAYGAATGRRPGIAREWNGNKRGPAGIRIKGLTDNLAGIVNVIGKEKIGRPWKC
jgi:hypothetical protein